jgi:type III restriction enzyme
LRVFCAITLLFWEKHSQGNCLFLMAVKKDGNGQGVHQQILNAIG